MESVEFTSCPPAGSAITVSGQFAMVAANGDKIDGTFETAGTLDPISGVSVQGSDTLISGTGRFVNVTGSGSITAQGAASPPFDFLASMHGVISYPR